MINGSKNTFVIILLLTNEIILLLINKTLNPSKVSFKKEELLFKVLFKGITMNISENDEIKKVSPSSSNITWKPTSLSRNAPSSGARILVILPIVRLTAIASGNSVFVTMEGRMVVNAGSKNTSQAERNITIIYITSMFKFTHSEKMNNKISNIPLIKSPNIIKFFLLTLSVIVPAKGPKIKFGTIPNAIIEANLPAEPVI